MKTKIEGPYDLKTIEFLIAEGIRDLGPSFSPKNFNFIQRKQFLNIYEELKKKYSSLSFYFDISGDSTLIINDFINFFREIKDKNSFFLDYTGSELDPIRELYLEKTDGIYVTYLPGIHDLKEILDIQNLRGIQLNFNDLDLMHQDGTFSQFVSNFSSEFYKTNSAGLELVLRARWDSDFFPSLFDFLEFDTVSYAIDPYVEQCFRNVNFDKLKECLTFCRPN